MKFWKLYQKVRVMMKNENSDTWKELHKGIIVGITTKFLRVWNPNKKDVGNYDTVPENAEWFAIDSKMIKILNA